MLGHSRMLLYSAIAQICSRGAATRGVRLSQADVPKITRAYSTGREALSKHKNAPFPGRSAATEDRYRTTKALLRNSQVIAAQVHCYTFSLNHPSCQERDWHGIQRIGGNKVFARNRPWVVI